ncbi:MULTISPECIES: metal ABC transporter solute-binding protein, Zn/Mn family [Acetobacter]|nr:zinc ABC transporter substrate-binding protein [Acetobacter pasteurianus]AKR47847.1 zinc ABC transporter substrate-binding protein [Acetobacter pasteurianus]
MGMELRKTKGTSRRMLFGMVAVLGFATMGTGCAAARPLSVVAAENTWGDLAAQIAEPDMHVTSILVSPAVDPHLYAPTPDDARRVADATLVVANGAGYDAWMDHLVQASALPQARYVRADTWSGWHEGGNAHLWYDLNAVADFVQRFEKACEQADPAHATAYAARGQKLQADIARVQAQAAALRPHVQGMAVAATEPLFTPLANYLGLDMKENAFQIAIMNDVEPPPVAVATFEQDLKQKKLRLLAYNVQVEEPASKQLIALAHNAGIPILPLAEIMPQDTHWQIWIGSTLTQVAHLLGVAQ